MNKKRILGTLILLAALFVAVGTGARISVQKRPTREVSLHGTGSGLAPGTMPLASWSRPTSTNSTLARIYLSGQPWTKMEIQ
jgi:hypothetical protein